MASSLFEQQSEGVTSDLSLSAGGESAKVHGALLHKLTPEISSLIDAFPSWLGSWTHSSLYFADTSPSLLPAVVELLYTGMTSLGVGQILEAHNLVKLLGLDVTLEHRGVDERRRQVRLEKDSEPHGGEVQGQATEFREPHPLNQSGKMVPSVENNSPSRKTLTGPNQHQSEDGRHQPNRGRRRRQVVGDLKMRSKTVATAWTSNTESLVGGSQYDGRLGVSRSGDHCLEHHEEGVLCQGGRLPESLNGELGNELQESSVVSAVGVDGWWKCELCGAFFKNQSNLAYHLATKNHYRERLLKEFGANGSTCPKCEKVLKSQKELLKHLAAVHKEVFTYYREELQGRGLNEKEDQELTSRRNLGESMESGDSSLNVENCQVNGGKVETNLNATETTSMFQERIGEGEENMELSVFETGKEESQGDTGDRAVEHAGVAVAFDEGTYLIENMNDEYDGQGETEDAENNVFIGSGVDCQVASHPDDLFMSKGDTVDAHICQFCDQGFNSDRTFMSHLASAHFWERLKQEYGNDVTTCPICCKVLTRSYATLHHIAEVHKVVMEYYAEKSVP